MSAPTTDKRASLDPVEKLQAQAGECEERSARARSATRDPLTQAKSAHLAGRLRDLAGGPVDAHLADLLREIADGVSALSALESDGWVSVKEHLPKFDQTVLVCWPSAFDGKPLYAFGARLDEPEGWLWGIRSGYCGWVTPGNDAGQNDIEADDDYPVTHWAPLLTPPAFIADQRAEE